MAITLEQITSLLIDLLSAAIAVSYMDLCFGRKYGGWKGLLCMVVGGIAYFAWIRIFSNGKDFGDLSGLGYSMILLIYASICLKGSFRDKVAMALLWLLLVLVSSFFIMQILLAMTGEELMKSDRERWGMMFYGSVFALIFKYILVKLVVVIREQVKGVRQERDQWMVALSYLMLFFLVQGVFSLEIEGLRETKGIYILSFLQLGLFGIVLCLAYFCRRMVVYHYEKHALEFDSERLKGQEEYIDNLGELCHELHLLRHDLSGRLDVLYNLVGRGEDEEALVHIKKLGSQVADLAELPEETGNKGLDTALMKTSRECKEKGIDFTHVISKEVKEIDSMDMGILFYNLFNNAVEACDKTAKKEIRLLVSGNGRCVTCTLENSIRESFLAKNPRLETDKADRACHGFGMQSIRRIVDKYNGIYGCREEDGMFVQEIRLFHGS